MAKKVKDLAVKLGEYTDNNGNTKGRWQNVGAMMQGDDGGSFLLLHRHFNPAGVMSGEGKDSILVSMFDSNRDGGGQQAPQQQSAPAAAPADYDDDIPF